jgi:bifunctional non-homologous end joining protein LigD
MRCGDDGTALFERIRCRRHDASVFLYAFDLVELNGDDLRREPLEWRKATLARLLARAGDGVELNEHLEAEGPVVFEHACGLGFEGIVSKRKASWYQSGRSRDWVKLKNPKAPAVTRLAEEDWSLPKGVKHFRLFHLASGCATAPPSAKEARRRRQRSI